MNFRFFSNMGRAAFNHFKSVPTITPPKNMFMNKIKKMEIVSLMAKTGLPLTSSGLMIHNLCRLLDKKQGSAKEIESILGTLIGASSQQGTILLDRILLDWILMNCSDYRRSTIDYEQYIEARTTLNVNI